MFEQAAERNDFWHRPHDYQIAAWKALLETGKTRVLFAEHEGEWLAGALFHIMGNKCWYMSSASTNEKRNLKPTYPLQWEIMRWAKQQGITCYDMVTIPSPEHLDDESHPLHGVYKFKAGFGGKIADFVGCLDLPVKPVRAGLWSRIEPIYFRLYQRLKGDIYY
jgi:lipid II:glycine glycyltransferase (peptidoglycan interpeptide bridge formation enzyme)